MSIEFENGDVLLFYGDSITEADRNKDNGVDLGQGYVKILASYLGYTKPEQYIKVINRGVGGDNIINLWERLEEDCLQFKPDVVSILVGLNDTTYRLWDDKNNTPISKEEFGATYRKILDKLTSKGCKKIIIMTPYLVEFTAEHKVNKALLNSYIPIIEDLAKEYNCTLVPLYNEFENKIKEGIAKTYTVDGVHLTNIGDFFTADMWCKYVLDKSIT